ncbi:hypothetical protein RN001_000577 [Aquatica leii]|uniref:Uncharacterized protein n=1 Tax=Aquatica leii TaxID=1421715 RepID=A0AAN7PKA9_9COLE|nr:hypothetical protein RN001_000577 [Aquatica leii]
MDKVETMEMIKQMHKQIDSGDTFAPDSLQKLASLLNNLELSDEEKEDLGESLNDLVGKLKSFSGPSMGMGGMDISANGNLLMQIVLVVAFVVVAPLFVFFGYKLYRSLTEKERKRDEKRKQKQMKKKK